MDVYTEAEKAADEQGQEGQRKVEKERWSWMNRP